MPSCSEMGWYPNMEAIQKSAYTRSASPWLLWKWLPGSAPLATMVGNYAIANCDALRRTLTSESVV